MNLKDNLEKLLKTKNWNLTRLSKESRVPRSTLQDWSTSQASINLEQLRRVAEALECSVFRLAYGLEEIDPYELDSENVLTELFSGRLQVTVHRVDRQRKKSEAP